MWQYSFRADPADTIIGGNSPQITYFGTSGFIPQDRPYSLLYTCRAAILAGLADELQRARRRRSVSSGVPTPDGS